MPTPQTTARARITTVQTEAAHAVADAADAVGDARIVAAARPDTCPDCRPDFACWTHYNR